MAADKVTIALVGIHGRGKTMARCFGALDVRIPVVCDVDSNIVVRLQSLRASRGSWSPRLFMLAIKVKSGRRATKVGARAGFRWDKEWSSGRREPLARGL